MELYFKLKMITEYILPFIILLSFILLCGVLVGTGYCAQKWEERERRINDKLQKKYEERESEGK